MRSFLYFLLVVACVYLIVNFGPVLYQIVDVALQKALAALQGIEVQQ